MKTLTSINQLRDSLATYRMQGERIAFVPTMGCLHQGHLSLVKQALDTCDRTVVSIFINPLQFSAGEDFATYPRVEEQDLAYLQELGVDLVFTPSADTLYPHGQQAHTVVSVPSLNLRYCGLSRPHFFDGVATVVTKLLNLVQPDVAIFGEKDYQQLLCIKKMATDLCLPIEIIAGGTVREPDGLAMSSRNTYLNRSERELAPLLFQQLQAVKLAILTSSHSYRTLEQEAMSTLNDQGFNTEYFSICHAETLDLWQRELAVPGTALVILTAAKLGATRLIDNCVFRV